MSETGTPGHDLRVFVSRREVIRHFFRSPFGGHTPYERNHHG